MKFHHLFIVAAAFLMLPSCEKKSIPEKMKDNVNDALDRRPGEAVRDAAEDAKDAVNEAGKAVKDAIEDSTK